MDEAEFNAVFSAMMRGSGSCPAWTHTSEDAKFGQFGWRCTTGESLYKPATLIGNWSEERFDIKELSKRKPLPPSTAHAFTTTYEDSFLKGKEEGVPSVLQHQISREPRSFESQQPELHSPFAKERENAWVTTSRSDYRPPAAQRHNANVPLPVTCYQLQDSGMITM